MTPEPTSPRRARGVALALLALLALVLIVRLTFSIPPIIFFGLVGGLVMSLVIVGLDLVHSIERKIDAGQGDGSADERRR
jgi:hypothetical protein